MSRPRRTLPDLLRGYARRLAALLRRNAADRELSDELAFHIDMETEQNIRAGLDPAQARRAAMLAFGGVDRISEQVRDTRTIGWLEDLIQDVRHAARGFRRAPGFTAAAAAALTLGIGANTAVFAVVYAVVMAPLPYAEPDRLVRLWEANPALGIDSGAVSPGTVADLRARSRTLQRIALFGERDMFLTDAGESWEAMAAAVSPALFDMLGAQPVIGRAFPREDDGNVSDTEAVIGHGLWQRRFGGDPRVLGRTIQMESRWSYTIVGVMPPGFAYPPGTEIWTPLAYSSAVSNEERHFRYYNAIAQLRPGRTVEQAANELRAIAGQLEQEHPASNAGWTVQIAPLDRSIVGSARLTLLVLFGLSGCVLLIACGNVATLAIARATARQHETAVRVALGAGTRRLLRQWTAEGLLLAALGGAGGVVAGYWITRLLLAIAPAGIPRLGEVVFRGPVLAFALLATCLTAMLVGLAPALRLRTTALGLRTRSDAGSDGSGSRSREWLLGTQIALTFVLTVAAALLLRSFDRLRQTELGFRRHDVLAAQVRVPIGNFRAASSPWFERLEFYDSLIAGLARLPGVRRAAGTTTIPLSGELGSGSMWRSDAPGAHGRRPPQSAADQWKAAIEIVTQDFLETMGIPVVRGRTFHATDRFTQQELADLDDPRPPGVAVVNETMARRYWPGGDPLGSRIVLFDDAFAGYRTIVGVVRDVRAESVDLPASPTVYLPFAQHPGRELSLVLRTDLPPEQLVGAVTDRLRSVGHAISITSVRPFDAVVGGALSRPRFTMLVVGSFAALALVIAVVGVFGIVGFLVARREHEIGIRMALGARPASVRWLVLRQGLRPVLLGVGVGGVAAMAVARAMQALLYGLAPLDGTSFAAAGLTLIVASMVAGMLPAHRIAGVDLLRSLRSE
ncbi:MAG TPA: ABC transporter permease [Gemmatimonadaceae bacterium]|nr:ABC transporter permease [Gemmatimonadaceae bacterium]